jgi:hypothetical protein
MNREDIIRMAQEAGEAEGMAEFVFHPVIERFADLVASAERDRMCEQFNLSRELAHEKAKSNETN